MASTLYVSTDGSSSNSGEYVSQPTTFAKALADVRADGAGKATIKFLGGTYTEGDMPTPYYGSGSPAQTPQNDFGLYASQLMNPTNRTSATIRNEIQTLRLEAYDYNNKPVFNFGNRTSGAHSQYVLKAGRFKSNGMDEYGYRDIKLLQVFGLNFANIQGHSIWACGKVDVAYCNFSGNGTDPNEGIGGAGEMFGVHLTKSDRGSTTPTEQAHGSIIRSTNFTDMGTNGILTDFTDEILISFCTFQGGNRLNVLGGSFVADCKLQRTSGSIVELCTFNGNLNISNKNKGLWFDIRSGKDSTKGITSGQAGRNYIVKNEFNDYGNVASLYEISRNGVYALNVYDSCAIGQQIVDSSYMRVVKNNFINNPVAIQLKDDRRNSTDNPRTEFLVIKDGNGDVISDSKLLIKLNYFDLPTASGSRYLQFYTDSNSSDGNSSTKVWSLKDDVLHYLTDYNYYAGNNTGTFQYIDDNNAYQYLTIGAWKTYLGGASTSKEYNSVYKTDSGTYAPSDMDDISITVDSVVVDAVNYVKPTDYPVNYASSGTSSGGLNNAGIYLGTNQTVD